MRKLILLMHTSLDGFVGTEEGSLDWIKINDELFGDVDKLTQACDAALYGRVTYDMMESYWPGAGKQPNATAHDIQHAEWYKNVTKYVVSRGKPATGDKAVVIGKNLGEELKKIKSQPGKDILMIGSPGTARAFMELSLIDEFRLNIYPVLLGKGISLYPQLNARVPLTLASSKTYAGGAVALVYRLA